MGKNLFLIIIFISALFSCSKDNDQYTYGNFVVELGTIQGDQSNFTVLADSGPLLYPPSNAAPWLKIANNDRVIINYTILNNKISGDKKAYYIKINRMNKILFKRPIKITPTNSDSLGNDGVNIINAWVIKNYLNISFQTTGGKKSHYINLGIDSISTSKGIVYSNFRHNTNGDSNDLIINSIVCFDLTNFRFEEQDSIKLKIRYKNLTDQKQELSLIYKYSD